MKCVVIRDHGDVDQLQFEDRPIPEPGPMQVRVKMAAIGVNHLDTWVRRGVPGHRFPLPLIPGSDGAGTVHAVGPGVTTVQPGDPVVLLPGVSCGACESCLRGDDNLCPRYLILGESTDGCCAEYVVVPETNVCHKPERLSMAEAATIPLVFQTAWAMLVSRARLAAGETVLIHAGGSGVGSAAVQIARFVGARVLTTAGSEEKCRRALALGADHAIPYQSEDFVDAVRALTGRRGVDVVFEHVGAATFGGSIKVLARGGRLVTCGATTGGQVPISLHQLFFKNLTLIGNTLGRKGDLLTVLKLVGQGRLQPVLDRVLPMVQVREAHRHLERRDLFGKVVLEL